MYTGTVTANGQVVFFVIIISSATFAFQAKGTINILLLFFFFFYSEVKESNDMA